MNRINYMKVIIATVFALLTYYTQAQTPVVSGSNPSEDYLIKWENTYESPYKISSANIREEESGLVIVGSVTTPFVEEEMFRVGGSIGLNAALDFKTPGSVISWGNGSDAASLNFLSKSLQPDNPVLSLDGANGLVGIGTLLPQAKLHLRSGEGENATMFIEPNLFSGNNRAMLYPFYQPRLVSNPMAA